MRLIQIALNSFHSSTQAANELSKRFTYHCCQARGTSNDRDKQSVADEKDQRITRRMQRFDCHGRLHVTIHDGVAAVRITHQQAHKPYVCIDIPEKWRTFIKTNQKMGPAKVCRRRAP